MSEDHIVRQGECLASIAARYGTTVEALWDDPQNQTLRDRRDSPFLLAPGDVVRVPAEPSSGLAISSGGSHRYQGRPPMVTVRLKLMDPRLPEQAVAGSETEDPELDPLPEPGPLTNCAFRLVAGHHLVDGTTDEEGLLVAEVPARTTVAKLILEPDGDRERCLSLRIGHLDPLDERSGALQRLENLGFKGPPEDEHDTIKAFQTARGLRATGELDDETKTALRDEAGC